MNITPSELLTIVIPARNSELTISFCLESIFASCEMAKCQFEVVLVLDRCVDSTGQLAREFPVRMVRCQGQGRSAARNTGAAVSSSRYLCFVDSDTVVELPFFSNLLKHLNEDQFDWIQASVAPVTPEQDDWFFQYFASSYHRRSNGTYNVLEGWRQPELPRGDSAALIVRRSAFERVGCFDTALVRAEDQDLARRFFLFGYHLLAALDLQSQKLIESKSLFQFYRYKLEGTWGLVRSRCRLPLCHQSGVFSRNPRWLLSWIRGMGRFFVREISGGHYKMAFFCLGLPLMACLEAVLFWIHSIGRFELRYEKSVRNALLRLGLAVDPFHPQSFGSITNSKGQFRFTPFHGEK